MTLRIISLTALALIALGTTIGVATAASPSVKAAPMPRCVASATASWNVRPNPDQPPRAGVANRRFRVEAFSDGPTCQKAVVVFVVRDDRGVVLHHAAYQSEYVAITKDARTRTQMQSALSEWVGRGASRDRHENLPNWTAGAPAPVPREFPFTPEDGITRAAYLTVKTNQTPLLCYVQGMESINCLVLREGTLEPLGIQSFPG